METRPVAVEVYSSYKYAVEPRAYRMDGERHVVQSGGRQWRTPGHLHFVCAEHDEFVELIYDESRDEWSLRDLKFSPAPTMKSNRAISE